MAMVADCPTTPRQKTKAYQEHQQSKLGRNRKLAPLKSPFRNRNCQGEHKTDPIQVDFLSSVDHRPEFITPIVAESLWWICFAGAGRSAGATVGRAEVTV
jgi:hypothetical protein